MAAKRREPSAPSPISGVARDSAPQTGKVKKKKQKKTSRGK